MKILALAGLLLFFATLTTQAADFDALRPDSVLHGFRAEAVYANDADVAIGARYRHEKTGFVFDLLRIESLPQGFVWVNSLATSDMGEPHTQEHLLLGKGNNGRTVGGLSMMTLTASSAFTEQWRTCYHFNTAGGVEAYWEVFERQLDALLHPDYTDEEIRREVRNIGVSEDTSGALRLEEKGTVYNEMVSSSDRPSRRLFRELDRLLWGPAHPLSWDSGGWPSAIREMNPTDIRSFHARAYRLGNMGMVGAFPASMPIDSILSRTDETLRRLEAATKNPSSLPFETEADFPAPKPAKPGTISIMEFPHQNDQYPGQVIFAWPPTRKLDLGDRLLAGFFLDSIAGEASTNLYKVFVDSRSREFETGATSTFGWVSSEQGNPFYVGLGDVAADQVRPETLGKIRDRIVTELRTVGSYADGSPELAAFNERVRSRVVERRRDLSKLVNSPPRFGFRGASSTWMSHLHELSKEGGFRRSVPLRPDLAKIEKLLASKLNFWKEALERWGLLAAPPVGVGVRPSSALVRTDQQERKDRLAGELARLEKAYSVTDSQEAIRRYRKEYDAASAALEAVARETRFPPFVSSPPMTLDDSLAFDVRKSGTVPVVASHFDNVTSATTGIAFRLDGVEAGDLPLLSILPELLSRVGVIDGGKPVSFEEMNERLRKEILGLDAYFSTNATTGRVELVLRGSGNDATEAERALAWMKLVLRHPDWRKENLSRIRDTVDQAWNGFRSTMQRSEEGWVNDPAEAWRSQSDPLLLATDSFLTQAASAHRLRWMLRSAPNEEAGRALDAWFAKLASVEPARAALLDLLGGATAGSGESRKLSGSGATVLEQFWALPADARPLAIEAAKDLRQVLDDIPDGSLAHDWPVLVGTLARDLATPPEKVLARLERLRAKILTQARARLFFVGSPVTDKRLSPSLGSLVGALPKGEPVTKRSRGGERLIEARLRERVSEARPVFVGLVVPHLKGGVFINSVPFVGFHDRDREKLLDYLASRLYVGYGAHGIFMKTWGAGLAYSNGFRGSLSSGELGYYAERTPELPQTLKFVIDLLKTSPREPALGEYAIAPAV